VFSLKSRRSGRGCPAEDDTPASEGRGRGAGSMAMLSLSLQSGFMTLLAFRFVAGSVHLDARANGFGVAGEAFGFGQRMAWGRALRGLLRVYILHGDELDEVVDAEAAADAAMPPVGSV
jgi:hypothetical protein